MSEYLTNKYSSSFSLSSKLYAPEFKQHIYAIYALVRIADEIVDTYVGSNAREILDDLEQDTYRAIATGYSANPVVYAFSVTAQKYGINQDLLEPFFASMRLDLEPKSYTTDLYQQYIHGSAEVVGLMCLRIFTVHNNTTYEQLLPAATALGSAYQKVNFLRDIANDYQQLGRIYFPGYSYENFDETAKQAIVTDIENDFKLAKTGIDALPITSRYAVGMSYKYYYALTAKLKKTPIETIKHGRVRIPSSIKFIWLVQSLTSAKINMAFKWAK